MGWSLRLRNCLAKVVPAIPLPIITMGVWDIGVYFVLKVRDFILFQKIRKLGEPNLTRDAILPAYYALIR